MEERNFSPLSSADVHQQPIASLGLSLSALLAVGAAASTPGAPLLSTPSEESAPDASTGQADVCLPSGLSYQGTLVRGIRQGHGLLTFKDGATFEGEFVSGEPHGVGICIWPDKSRYEGAVRRGMRHGEGKMFHAPTGSEYSGGWVGSQREGWGVMRYGCGAVYEGQWVAGKRQGRGTLRHATGNCYVGEWRGDCKEGCGRFVWLSGPNEGQEYVGSWRAGVPHGWGVHTWYSIACATAGAAAPAAGLEFVGLPVVCRYRGQFWQGAREGVGVMAYGNGGSYWGAWQGDAKSGFGLWAAADGSVFDAGFARDNPVQTLAGVVAGMHRASTSASAAGWQAPSARWGPRRNVDARALSLVLRV